MRFRASDVFLPTAEELGDSLPADAEMEGAIVDFSDSGLKRRAFAIVEVGRERTMVVPVEKLKLVAPASGERES